MNNVFYFSSTILVNLVVAGFYDNLIKFEKITEKSFSENNLFIFLFFCFFLFFSCFKIKRKHFDKINSCSIISQKPPKKSYFFY